MRRLMDWWSYRPYGCACGKWFRNEAALQRHDRAHYQQEAREAKRNG